MNIGKKKVKMKARARVCGFFEVSESAFRRHAYSESSQTSKMELCPKIVKGWKLLTFFLPKVSSQMFWLYVYLEECRSNNFFSNEA